VIATATVLDQLVDMVLDLDDGWSADAQPESTNDVSFYRWQDGSQTIQVEIDVKIDPVEGPFMHVRTRCILPDGHVETVSTSMHNAINRRAIDAINAFLDKAV
jgi:hypothetical protein